MSTIAIIQARMGSTRLPGKVLKLLVGRPMLWHIVHRVKASEGVDSAIVATSERSENDVIRDFCAKEGIDCYAGSEDDVLDRFHRIAEKTQATTVLRLTADCPLADPDLIGRLITAYHIGNYDFMSTAAGAGASRDKQPRFPDGLDCEVMRAAVLNRAWCGATKPLDREHVTPYVWRNPQFFKIGKLSPKYDLSHLRFTVDRAEDFELISRIYAALYSSERHFLLDDVLAFLAQHPGLAVVNHSGIGQEGYEALWEN